MLTWQTAPEGQHRLSWLRWPEGTLGAVFCGRHWFVMCYWLAIFTKWNNAPKKHKKQTQRRRKNLIKFVGFQTRGLQSTKLETNQLHVHSAAPGTWTPSGLVGAVWYRLGFASEKHGAISSFGPPNNLGQSVHFAILKGCCRSENWEWHMTYNMTLCALLLSFGLLNFLEVESFPGSANPATVDYLWRDWKMLVGCAFKAQIYV